MGGPKSRELRGERGGGCRVPGVKIVTDAVIYSLGTVSINKRRNSSEQEQFEQKLFHLGAIATTNLPAAVTIR